MFTFTVLDDMITGSVKDVPFSIPFSKESYETLQQLEEELEHSSGKDEYTAVLEKVSVFVAQDLNEIIESECPYLKINRKTGEYHLYYNQVTSKVAMPKALVTRILDSHEKGLDFMPLIKMWVRFLRNPLLKKKGKPFAKRFFNFINMTYVHPEMQAKFMKDGYSKEVATKKATMYQMKITKEGLLSGYKVSSEIMHKFVADEDGNPKKVNRYQRTFDPNTGKITSEGLPATVEERLFEPAVMGDRGDAFSCTGTNGMDGLGHFIKVGCVHALPSWDMVNTDDNISCVPGLHVGGLYYIANYTGEIHNVFIDPMHVGAVPDDNLGAIRCKQYFVHSSLTGVNGSIYHSSEYAKLTDDEWQTALAEAVSFADEAVAKAAQDLNELKAL
jgi:hypothetical protein